MSLAIWVLSDHTVLLLPATHPTQVNTRRLNPRRTGRYSIYVPRRNGRLTWLAFTRPHVVIHQSTNPEVHGRESNSRPVDHKSDALNTSFKECRTTQLVWYWQQSVTLMPSRSYASSIGCQYGSAFNTRWRYWRVKFVHQVLLAISTSTSPNMWLHVKHDPRRFHYWLFQNKDRVCKTFIFILYTFHLEQSTQRRLVLQLGTYFQETFKDISF